MKIYIAKTMTSIFPFGIVTKGEVLQQKHLDALGEETLEDMVRRGSLEAREDGEQTQAEETAKMEKPAADPEEGTDEAPETGDETGADETPKTGDDAENDEEPEIDTEAEAPEIDALDAIVAPAAEPEAAKPAKRGGRKKEA